MAFPRVRRRRASQEKAGSAPGGQDPVGEGRAAGQGWSVASAPLVPEAASRNWRIMPDGIIDPETGRRYALVRHGLDAATATEQVLHSRVVLGRFPLAQEITGDAIGIRDALRELSTSGAHFSYFASLYRVGADGLLLVDYIS